MIVLTHAGKGTDPDIMSVCLRAGVCERQAEEALALSAEHSVTGAVGQYLTVWDRRL